MEFVAESKFLQVELEAKGEDTRLVIVVGWSKRELPRGSASVPPQMKVEPVVWWPRYDENPITLDRLRELSGIKWKALDCRVRHQGSLG